MTGHRDLPRAVLTFVDHLRRLDLPVTTGAAVDAVRALEHIDLAARQALQLALRTVLTSRVEEQPLFDRCFEEFWRALGDDGRSLENLLGDARPTHADGRGLGEPRGPTWKTHSMPAADEADGASSDGESAAFSIFSDRETLMEKDFASFTTDELEEVAQLATTIARRLARRLSRRRRPSSRRGLVDLRRSVRANLTKGELIDLRHRTRRRRRLRLVLLCDVSGSMDLYSRLLLQFVYALQNAFGRVETFTFATRLTRVSDILRGAAYAQMTSRLGAVRDWSGGTRIGRSFAEFNASWARLVDRHTAVLIISDGWDVGDPDLLVDEMLAIRRRAGRIVWLNPLLGTPTYEPLNRGMAAALPYVDDFVAAHNLASLRDLAGRLSRLQGG